MHFITKTFALLLQGLAVRQVSAQDTTKFTTYKDLPLKPQRKVSFTTTEGTWTSLRRMEIISFIPKRALDRTEWNYEWPAKTIGVAE